MGRTIHSVSMRIDARLMRWEGFAKHLGVPEREAYRKLAVAVRNRRGAIDAADEADIGIAMLLAMMVSLKHGNRAGSREVPCSGSCVLPGKAETGDRL